MSNRLGAMAKKLNLGQKLTSSRIHAIPEIRIPKFLIFLAKSVQYNEMEKIKKNFGGEIAHFCVISKILEISLKIKF